MQKLLEKNSIVHNSEILKFEIKMRQVLQNEAKVITKRGRYYKTRQRLLQNAAGVTKRGNYTKRRTHSLTRRCITFYAQT